MRKVVTILGVILAFFIFPLPAFAAGTDLATYTTDTLNLITIIATAAATLFLIKGGYLYFTSAGQPQALDEAKKTIRNSLMGLVVVLSAGLIISIFKGALPASSTTANSAAVTIAPITTIKPSDGLSQVLIDAVSAFIQNIVESSTKPIVDGIIGFLTTTPNLLGNSVITNFWLVSLGIVDTLFVLVVALLGLHFMSASTLGFEEVELKQLLPRIGTAFLGANISLFLADYVITTANTLVKTILDSTGGLSHAWIMDAINPVSFATGTTPLITLIFLVLFLILAVVLLLMYIARLITISLGAVLSPFIFLLWTLPKFSDFAEIAIKSYVATVFTVFIHVVVIQLAAAFLTIPGNSNNSLLAIAIAIGLFLTLLKVPGTMMQMVFYTSRNGTFKKMGSQIVNVMTTERSSSATAVAAKEAVIKVPRKAVAI